MDACCVYSLPAKDRGLCVVMRWSSTCQEESWTKIA